MAEDPFETLILEIQTLALSARQRGNGQRLRLYHLREKAWEAIVLIDAETLAEYRRRNAPALPRRNSAPIQRNPAPKYGVDDL